MKGIGIVLLVVTLVFITTAVLAQDPPVIYTPIPTTTAVAPATAPSATTVWEREPATYRDVPFGATLEEAKAKGIFTKCTLQQKHRFSGLSEPINAFVGEIWCESELNLTNDIKLTERWSFKNNRLYKINVTFPLSKDHTNYPAMKVILQEKYGNPTNEVQVDEKLCAKGYNCDSWWKGKNVSTEFTLYFIAQTVNAANAQADAFSSALLGALGVRKTLAQQIADAQEAKQTTTTYVPVTGVLTFYVINHEEDAATKDKTKAAATKF